MMGWITRTTFGQPESAVRKVLATRNVLTVAWASLAICLLLMAVRVGSAISFDTPLMVITSGAEEETALSLWRYIKGLDIYQDPRAIPFSAAIYNWLFYVFYGEVVKLVLDTLSLDDIWLLTVSRYVTLAWTAAGAYVAYAALRMVSEGSQTMRALAAPFALFLFFGPLIGFWAISLNMDVAAATCAVVAVLVFCRSYDETPVKAIVLASLASYAAWSFKQSYVAVPGALGLFLVVRRDWRGVILLGALHAAAWGMPLLFGSRTYVKMMLFLGIDSTLDIRWFWRVLLNVVVKIPPILAAVLLIPAFFVRRADAWRVVQTDTRLLFPLCGIVVAAIMTLPMSAKIGAAENYYFVLVFFLTLGAFATGAKLVGEGNPFPLAAAALIAGWLAVAGASTLVLTGAQGIVSVRHWHGRHVAEQKCLRGLPGPVFPYDPYLALPWMTDAEPRFLLFYPYRLDRVAGKRFERGGVGGLIAEGFFGSIVLRTGSKRRYDGASLDKYVLRKEDCANMDIYFRKP